MKKLLFIIATSMVVSAMSMADETITDICGNSYPVVKIGAQMWMAENLRCNKYDTESEAYNAFCTTCNTIPTTSKSGITTPYYIDATDRDNWVLPKADDLSSEQINALGYLYNWAAAVGIDNGPNQTTDFIGNRQGICPNGWHVPTKDEWQTLYDYIYNDQNFSKSNRAVGKCLKTTSGWYVDKSGINTNGTDDYGFSALPVGNGQGSHVYGIGGSVQFWTATTNAPNAPNSSHACDCHLNRADSNLQFSTQIKYCCDIVRCVKNLTTSTIETESDQTMSISKRLIDGKIVIVKGDEKYNLQGVEIR